jgi:hypothetical protein
MRTVFRFLGLGALVGVALCGGLALLEHQQISSGIQYHDASAGTYYFGILLGTPVSFIGFWIGDNLSPRALPDSAVFPLLVLNWTLVGGLIGWLRREKPAV